MKKSLLLTPCILTALTPSVFARGVSPYLPLHLEPEFERQIERVLILGDKPVLTRPIAAATVLEALPKACEIDRALCEQVRRLIGRYTKTSHITNASVQAGSTNDDSSRIVPNSHGMPVSSLWQASLQAYLQPSDYIIVNAGAIAYEGEVLPTGSMLSIGIDRAQLDIGFREHWLSPLTDSSMLLSTEAPTMPSVTLSNYVPLTRFGLKYEAFIAKMSYSENISFQGGSTAGSPRLAGLHLSTEPVRGWALGFNRIMQYGGGQRGGSSIRDLFDAFVQPSRFDNAGDGLSVDEQFGNQAGSITSRFLFPGKTPFSVYFEYAGEDTSRGKNYLLGNAALSAGIHFPRLFKRFDLTYEVSEWQNAWYIHNIYRDGLLNDGQVIGHWGADQRVFLDDTGSQTHMLRVGWEPHWGGLFEVKLRTVDNASYSVTDYERGRDITARYSIPVKQFTVGGEVFAGRDVFGESYSRAGAFFRYTPSSSGLLGLYEEDSGSPGTVEDNGAEVFIDAGANANQVKSDLASELPTVKSKTAYAPHFAIGARRAVSEHSDFGVRIEYDDIDGRSLIGARAVDYRYRFNSRFALGGFLGAARYDLETPAYGFYGGVGAQLRNLLPGWDLGVDLRYASKVARDHLLPSDPGGVRPDSFYDITSTTLYITKRF